MTAAVRELVAAWVLAGFASRSWRHHPVLPGHQAQGFCLGINDVDDAGAELAAPHEPAFPVVGWCPLKTYLGTQIGGLWCACFGKSGLRLRVMRSRRTKLASVAGSILVCGGHVHAASAGIWAASRILDAVFTQLRGSSSSVSAIA